MVGCDCAESKALGLGKAMIKATVMDGIRSRSEWARMIQCAHCDKILKYFGTVSCTMPDGTRGYRTVTF